MIRPEINGEYRALCAKESPVTDFLFGEDLPKRLQEISATNKLQHKLAHQSSKFSKDKPPRKGSRQAPRSRLCTDSPHTAVPVVVEGTPPYAWIGKAASLLGRVEIGYNTVESQWKKQTRGALRRGYVGCNKLLFYRKKIPWIGASAGCYQGQLSYYCCSPGQLVLLPG